MSECQDEPEGSRLPPAFRHRRPDDLPLRPHPQRMLAVTSERLVSADWAVGSFRFLPAIPADREARFFD
jgi:hypothetical protein